MTTPTCHQMNSNNPKHFGLLKKQYFLKQQKNFELFVKKLHMKLENDIYCYGRLENTP